MCMAPQECHKLQGPCFIVRVRCANDQQTSSARVWGKFTVSRKLVSASTAAFHAAMEPQPLWTGSLPVCLVEYHQGHSRRLRLVQRRKLSLQKGNVRFSISSTQCRSHARQWPAVWLCCDRYTDPDWCVLPDGHQPNAWKLLHAARKGGDRFCVGSGPRYAPRQADLQTKPKSISSSHSIRSGINQHYARLMAFTRTTPKKMLPQQEAARRNQFSGE